MDQRLVAWARAVKSRRRHLPGAPPPLWLFTDPARTPDVVAAVRRLPPGLCGVVLRHDGGELLRAVAAACRTRRAWLSVAGRAALPGTGRHRRGGRGPRAAWSTGSAHDGAQLARCRGCRAAFVSPVFPTVSHPGAPAWGVVRWAGLARSAGNKAFALGGIDGVSARRLPRWVGGAGAIGALSG